MRLIVISAAAALCAALGANAQELALSDLASRSERAAPTEFSDAEVTAFADALHAAVLVDDLWAPLIAGANSLQEAERLNDEAQRAMVAAVEAAGISVETFGRIYTQVQGDADLAERVSIAVEDRFAG